MVVHFEPLLPLRLTSDAIQIRRDARRVPLAERASLYRDRERKTPRDIGDRLSPGMRRYRVTRTLDK
jgi:hypothetical protein